MRCISMTPLKIFSTIWDVSEIYMVLKLFTLVPHYQPHQCYIGVVTSCSKEYGGAGLVIQKYSPRITPWKWHV